MMINWFKVGDGTIDHGFAFCHELYEEEVPEEIANIKPGTHGLI